MQALSTRLWRQGAAMQAATAAALAAGCLSAPGFAHAGQALRVFGGEQAPLDKKREKQVATAERAVLKAPGDAAARLRLGQSYLAAGRFASAATSFEDAVALGDRSPATALSMALSYMGAGRNLEAIALLQQWRDTIPASDYGLALALAGRPAEAVAVLGEAIKEGEATPKARQNLAYAYALGGHLREARLIAAQDVPAEQLDARISDWALQGSVASQQSRVAAMLGAPLRSDPGQPARLTLAAPAPVLAEMPKAPAAPAREGELPPVPSAAPMAPVFAQAPRQEAPGIEPARFAAADAASAELPVIEPGPAEIAPVPSRADAARFVSSAVVQAIPQAASPRAIGAEAPAKAHAARKALAAVARPARAAPAPAAAIGRASTHAVQLGSFLSEESARRAWEVFLSRDPSLRTRELRITQAVVNGRRYWRVSAAGYDALAARDMCSAVRSRGRDCLAYAERKPRPGSLPARAVAERLARN